MIVLLGYYSDGRRFAEGFDSQAKVETFRVTQDYRELYQVEATEDELRQARSRLRGFVALLQRSRPA